MSYAMLTKKIFVVLNLCTTRKAIAINMYAVSCLLEFDAVRTVYVPQILASTA